MGDRRPERASKAIDEALGSGIRDAGIFYHAAAIKHANGEADAARLLLQSALTINPHFHPTEAEAARALQKELG